MKEPVLLSDEVYDRLGESEHRQKPHPLALETQDRRLENGDDAHHQKRRKKAVTQNEKDARAVKRRPRRKEAEAPDYMADQRGRYAFRFDAEAFFMSARS